MLAAYGVRDGEADKERVTRFFDNHIVDLE